MSLEIGFFNAFELFPEVTLAFGKYDAIFMHQNEFGNSVIERCYNTESIYREYHVGQKLDNDFIICGGQVKSGIKDDCIVIGNHGMKSFPMVQGRVSASSVKLNDTTMWITGGRYFRK